MEGADTPYHKGSSDELSQRERDRERGSERERENSNSKILFSKDCSLGSFRPV